MRTTLIVSATLLTAFSGAVYAQTSEESHARYQTPRSIFPALGAYVSPISSPSIEKETATIIARRPEAPTRLTQVQSQPQQAASAKASGTVNSVDTDGRKLNVTHAPIPQIGWPGMTMDFAVSDKVDLKTVKPGDKVEFTLQQGSGGMYMIDSLSK